MTDETAPADIYSVATDDAGVVTFFSRSNVVQPEAQAVSEEVFAEIVARGGRAKFDGTTVTDYTPPAPSPVIPDSASRLGLMRALKEIGKWNAAKTAIAANAEVQEEWDLAIAVRRDDPLTQGIIQVLGLSPSDVDALLVRAAALAG